MSQFGGGTFACAKFSGGHSFGRVKFGGFKFGPSVIFMGDSISQRYPLHTYWTNCINAGIPGNTSAQMLSRFDDDVLKKSPQHVHILAGTNDVLQSLTSLQHLEDMALAADEAGIMVTLATIPPLPTPGMVDDWNDGVSEIALENGFALADYYSQLLSGGVQDASLFIDGVHPNGYGYARMRSVAPARFG